MQVLSWVADAWWAGSQQLYCHWNGHPAASDTGVAWGWSQVSQNSGEPARCIGWLSFYCSIVPLVCAVNVFFLFFFFFVVSVTMNNVFFLKQKRTYTEFLPFLNMDILRGWVYKVLEFYSIGVFSLNSSITIPTLKHLLLKYHRYI